MIVDDTGIVLAAGSSRATVDPAVGGRLASLVVAGAERLVTASDGADPMAWGSYPMVPWAGRVRAGWFRHEGREVRLPLRLPPHAIHGTVLDRPWDVLEVAPDHVVLRTDLGPDWPWPGHVEQELHLGAGGLRCRLAVHAHGEAFPAQVGWHPWFTDGGRPPRLTFAAQAMYRRDAAGIPTGDLVTASAHPWDDCLVGVSDPPQLHYADGLTLTLMSDCDHWVVYEPEHAVCVEPQSGPPDAFNLAPVLVAPGRPLSRTFTVSWPTAPPPTAPRPTAPRPTAPRARKSPRN